MTALIALALIAGFGVFGGTLLGGVSGQAKALQALPVSLSLAGWALCAVPAAGLFGLVMPFNSRIIRLLSGTLLALGILATMALSKPRGMDNTTWRTALTDSGVDPAAFLHAMTVTTSVLFGTALLWALVAAIAAASTRRTDLDELWAAVQRSAFWVGPLAIAASYAAVRFF